MFQTTSFKTKDKCECLKNLPIKKNEFINTKVSVGAFEDCVGKLIKSKLKYVKVIEKQLLNKSYVYILELNNLDSIYKSILIFDKKHVLYQKFIQKYLFKTELSTRHAIYYGNLNYRIVNDSTIDILFIKHLPVKQDTLDQMFSSINAPGYHVEEQRIKL
jgi:hypothetical protein